MKINFEPNPDSKTDKQLRDEYKRDLLQSGIVEEFSKKVPIKRGCPVRNGGCFCTGVCQEVIGWRDKVPGEF